MSIMKATQTKQTTKSISELDEAVTTMKVRKKNLKRLNMLKLHSEQSADEILEMVLDGKLEDLRRVREHIEKKNLNAPARIPTSSQLGTWAEENMLGYPNYLLDHEVKVKVHGGKI